jgi:F0F1-type ATP synthase assembly protein I
VAEDPSPEERQRGLTAEIITAGITFPVCVVLGWLGGSFADRKLGTSPIGVLLGVLLGLGAALVPVFRISQAYERIEEEKRKRGKP